MRSTSSKCLPLAIVYSLPADLILFRNLLSGFGRGTHVNDSLLSLLLRQKYGWGAALESPF